MITEIAAKVTLSKLIYRGAETCKSSVHNVLRAVVLSLRR